MFMKRHIGFFIFFSAVIFLFLGKLIFMKSGFISGDYLAQFYPWTWIYTQALKNFEFSFWTRYFHSGFPLIAEGQVAGLYPLNIIMFFALPFKIAYNYSVILHFILAGIFTYLYCRKLGADQSGGCLSALLFCFGSAYAGCFYNIITLKTLVWFPLVLLLIENFISSKKNYYIIFAGLIAGTQFLAGFFQMASFAFVFYVFYLLYRLSLEKNISLSKKTGSLIIFGFLSILIALPQVLLTYPLAKLSGRTDASIGFALWKSFPPPLVMSLVFPSWLNVLGSEIFIGTLSLLFIIFAVTQAKNQRNLRPIILIGVLAFLAALGKYNPLYVLILKISKFYSFRNPSKFLFFTMFAGSVLAGYGFSKISISEDKRLTRLSAGIFSGLTGFCLVIFLCAKSFLKWGRDIFMRYMYTYITQNVYGKPYHKYDLKTYIQKAQKMYDTLLIKSDLANPFLLFSIIMAILCLFIGVYIFYKSEKFKKIKLFLFTIIFLDIFVYSFYGTGFRGNIQPFTSLKPTHTSILNILKQDKDLYRIAPFGLRDPNMPFWTDPNTNALFEIDSIAAYTPLVMENYQKSLQGLEIVDSSLGLLSPENNVLKDYYSTIQLLNVKYIITTRNLDFEFLKHIESENNVNLYQLQKFMPRVFFTVNPEQPSPDQVHDLKIKTYKSGLAEIYIVTEQDGFLIFSENHDPKWRAYVNGEQQPLLKIKNLIQGVKITKGSHTVKFVYKPFSSRLKTKD